MPRVIKQRRSEDNAVAAMKNLLLHNGTQVTLSSINKLKAHPEYPSLAALSEHLSEWNIDHAATHLQPEHLDEVSFPCIAHLKNNGGHFVVLTSLKKENITYIDPELGIVEESIKEFTSKWTGATLLVEFNQRSGERNYLEKRKREKLNQASNVLTVGLASLCVFLPLLFMSFSIVPHYIVKIAGAFICLLLVGKQFGVMNDLTDMFCKTGTHNDCNSVINSSGSKIFGLIYLSELGMLYFIGSIMAIAFASLAGLNITGFIIITNVLLLPLVLASLYYQKWVVKSWCRLCLGVAALIITENSFAFFYFATFSPTLPATLVVLLSFALPLIFWMATRERFIESFRVVKLETAVKKFRMNHNVFNALLENQQSMPMGDFSDDIVVGNSTALISITLVSSMSCNPCQIAHVKIKEVLDDFPDLVKVKLRYMTDLQLPDLDQHAAIHQVFAHVLSKSETNVFEMLSDWFEMKGKKDLVGWKEKYPLTISHQLHSTISRVIQEQQQWIDQNDFTRTPIVFIDDKRYPDEFSLNDLSFHIRKSHERVVAVFVV